MITDRPFLYRPVYHDDITIRSAGGSAGPAATSSSELPPLPRCKNHPRRELELFCKLCEASMCSTCKETEHSECQRKWDEMAAEKGSPRSM
jgi:hypothetical protein